jgi:uncharacterized LabA/DUF88 family protein
MESVAIFLDGGFVKVKLEERLKRFPTSKDVVDLCTRIMATPRLSGQRLFRLFFYDADPFEGTVRNPLNRRTVNLTVSNTATANRALLSALELEDDFAVRRGDLVCHGWKLGRQALKNLSTSPRQLQASDLVPQITQKGVDLKLGLDIAWIALKRLASVIVLVSGDSDLVPAMKFARKEGLKVYLEPLGHGVRREMKAHADVVLNTPRA